MKGNRVSMCEMQRKKGSKRSKKNSPQIMFHKSIWAKAKGTYAWVDKNLPFTLIGEMIRRGGGKG